MNCTNHSLQFRPQKSIMRANKHTRPIEYSCCTSSCWWFSHNPTYTNTGTEPWPQEQWPCSPMHFQIKNSVYASLLSPNHSHWNLPRVQRLSAYSASCPYLLAGQLAPSSQTGYPPGMFVQLVYDSPSVVDAVVAAVNKRDRELDAGNTGFLGKAT